MLENFTISKNIEPLKEKTELSRFQSYHFNQNSEFWHEKRLRKLFNVYELKI